MTLFSLIYLSNETVSPIYLQESFYYGLTDQELIHVHDYNFDHPGRIHSFTRIYCPGPKRSFTDSSAVSIPISDTFDTELLLSCMKNLKRGKAVDIPNYNFKTYKSVPNARKVLPFKFSAICNPPPPGKLMVS